MPPTTPVCPRARRALLAGCAAALAVIGLSAVPAPVADLYDPLQLRNVSLQLEPLAGWVPPTDWVPPEGWDAWTEGERAAHLDGLAREAAWDVVRFDTTFTAVLPAWLSAEGETPIRVGVRRKSSRALPSEADPRKVGLKIGISDFVSGQLWHGVSKLSLENGGDISPVAEGLAWIAHQRAAGPGLYETGYDPALAAWVTVTVNGAPLGVYTSVEQRNKQFMRNRGLWSSTGTWNYEADDLGAPVLEDGPAALPDGTVPDSPAHQALCYPPFLPPAETCATPDDATLAVELPMWIDMEAMLTEGAVDAYTANNDALISKGKNFNAIDRLGEKRRYYPWDLDAVFGKNGTVGTNIYALSVTRNKRGVITGATQSDYQRVVLNHPDFRAQYNAVMLRLLDGPLSTTALHGLLHSIEPLLTPALEQDPYVAAVIGPSVSEHFNGLRAWIAQRDVAVREQVAANLPAPRAPYPGGRDTTAPAVSSLRLSPTTAGPGGAVAVTASVSDEGGVVSADAQAGTLGWMPMQATSGAFGDATVSVSGSVIAPADTGSHPVCVRASDVAGNVNVPVCITLTVDARVPTTLAYTGPSAVRTGATVTLTAQLTASASAVVGRTVTFVFNKLTYSAPTTANGVASVTVKAPTKIGTYPVALQFAGDDAHLPSSSSASVTVTR